MLWPVATSRREVEAYPSGSIRTASPLRHSGDSARNRVLTPHFGRQESIILILRCSSVQTSENEWELNFEPNFSTSSIIRIFLRQAPVSTELQPGLITTVSGQSPRQSRMALLRLNA